MLHFILVDLFNPLSAKYTDKTGDKTSIENSFSKKQQISKIISSHIDHFKFSELYDGTKSCFL